MRDAVVEICDGLGHEVSTFQNAYLVSDVGALSLKAPADNAFHQLTGLVVFVLLLEQYLRAGAILIKLLVRHVACVPVP